MSFENKKMMIEGRIATLEARGSHNNRIANKWKRKLRKLLKDNNQ